MRLKFSIIIFLLISSCTTKENNIIYHPTNDNLEPNNDDIVVIQNKIKNKDYNLFNNYKNILDIGSLNERDEIFSEITDVDIYQNYIFILDFNAYNLFIYDIKNDDLLGDKNSFNSLSKTLNKPFQIEIFKDNLYVLDNFNTIKKFDLTFLSSGQIKDQNEYQFNSIINQFCVQENELILKSPNLKENTSKALYHVFDFDKNEIKFSFGKPYLSKDPMVQEVLSEGIFECIDSRNKVVSTKFILPFINIIDTKPSKELNSKTTYQIKEYKPQKHREVQRKSLKYRWDSSKIIYDKFISVNSLNSFIFIQKERKISHPVDKTNIQDESISIDTYLINLEHNLPQYLGDNFNKIMFLNDNFLVTKKDTPYPSIKIYENH